MPRRSGGPISLEFRRAAGRVFQRARVAAGLEQLEAARRLGMSQANLSRVEHGYQALTFAQLWQLCDVYGCSAVELVRRLEQLWIARDLLEVNHV